MVSHEKVDLLQLAAITAAAAIIQKRHRMFGGRKSAGDSSVSCLRRCFARALMSLVLATLKRSDLCGLVVTSMLLLQCNDLNTTVVSL